MKYVVFLSKKGKIHENKKCVTKFLQSISTHKFFNFKYKLSTFEGFCNNCIVKKKKSAKEQAQTKYNFKYNFDAAAMVAFYYCAFEYGYF